MKDVLLYGPSITHQSLKGLGDIQQEINSRQLTLNLLNIAAKQIEEQIANKERLLIKYSSDAAMVAATSQELKELNKRLEANKADISRVTLEIADLNKIKDGGDMFSTAPTVTVTVQPTTAPKTIILPTPEATPTQTTPEPEPEPEPVQTPIFNFPSFVDEGNGTSEPEGESDAEIYDIVDEAPGTETETTAIKIPWYVYALGAGALLLGGVLIFGKKKKKNN